MIQIKTIKKFEKVQFEVRNAPPEFGDLSGGRRAYPASMHTFPATPFLAWKMMQILSQRHGDFEIDEGFKYYVTSAVRSMSAQEYKTRVPDLNGKIKYNPERPLWPHQIQSFAYAYTQLDRTGSVGLWLDMGAGKTKVALALIENIPNIQRVLIVCPLAVIAAWEHQGKIHPLNPLTLTYHSSEKHTVKTKAGKLQNSKWDRLIYIINYESAWRKPLGDTILSIPWDMVILDEIHRIKNPSTSVTKFFHQLSLQVPRRVGMSGTPLANHPMDAYSIYKFLDRGIFQKNFEEFKRRYFVMDEFTGFEKVKKYINQEEFTTNLYLNSIRFETADVLQLPGSEDIVVPLQMVDKKQIRHYEEMAEQFTTELQCGEVTAANGAVKMSKLQQITSGFCYKTDTGEIDIFPNNPKLDWIKELDETIDEPFVIFCKFTAEANMLHNSLVNSCLLTGEKNELVQFQNGNKKIIIVNMQSGSEGIDLTRARYCVYMSYGSLRTYQQSRRRILRPGQNKNVYYYHLQFEGTYDTKIYNALIHNQEIIDYLLKEKNDESERPDYREPVECTR